jgi:hypothetical protein
VPTALRVKSQIRMSLALVSNKNLNVVKDLFSISSKQLVSNARTMKDLTKRRQSVDQTSAGTRTRFSIVWANVKNAQRE